MKKLVTLLILLLCTGVFSQVITSYNFGTTATAVSTFSFTSTQAKTSGTDDWAITTSTATTTTMYAGASGGASVTADNSHNTSSITKTLTTPAISTSGKYNIIVSWAERKTSTFTAPVTLEYSTDNGSNWSALSYVDNEDCFIASLGTQTYYALNHVRLPAAAENKTQLKLRWSFATQGNSGTIRFDDVYLCAYNKTWTGSGGDNSWGTASNWSGSAVPGSTDYVLIDNTNVSGNFYVDCASTATVGALAVYGGSNTVTLNYKTGAAITANNNTLTDILYMNGAYVKCFIAASSAMLYATSAGIDASYGSTIELNYSGSETFKDACYGSLVVSGTGTKTWTTGGFRRATGSISVSVSSATLAIGSGNPVAIYGDVTVASGATLSFGSGAGRFVNSAASKTCTINGVVRITATTTQSTTAFSYQCSGFATYSFGTSSWVSFRNASTTAATQGIDGITGTPYANVELAGVTNLTAAGTNTFSINTNLEITGTLAFPRVSGTTNTSLAINFNSYTVKVGGAIQLDGTNTNGISGGRTYTAGTSTIELNGSSGQGIGGTDLPQTFNNLTFNNSAGVTLNSGITINGISNLVAGSITTGANAITYGASSTLKYSGSSQQTCTNAEFPASSGPYNLTIANSNGVVLHAARTISGTFTLTSGTLTTTATNILTLSGTGAGAVLGGSATSYVNGPLQRTLPASLASGSTYTFPIGKGAYNLLELVNPTTNSGGTVVVYAEVVDDNCNGTAGTGLSTLASNRYWQTSITTGSANFTNSTIRLTESGLTATAGIGHSGTVGGTYNSLGGTFTGTKVATTSSATTLDYFVIGTRNDMTPLASGTYTVGASGTYANLTAVITELSSKIITGGNVIFELGSDYTSTGETFPLTFYPFASDDNTRTVTIRPASTVNATVSANTTGAVVELNAAQKLYFDGRDGGSTTNKYLTIANGANGGQAVKFLGDAANNSFNYVNLSAQSSTVAATGVVLFSTGTSTGNNNNTITNCDINGNGSYIRGIYSIGLSESVMNSGNTVSYTNIYDWYNNSVAATSNSAVYLDSYNSGWSINNNSIYYTTSYSPANANYCYPIYINTTGSGMTINNNYIGGNGPNGGSGNLSFSSTTTENRFWAINIQALGNSSATNIQGNTISKISLPTKPASSGIGIMYGIYLGQGSVNIGTTAGNTIGSGSDAGAITVNIESPATNTTYIDGIRLSNSTSSDVVNVGSGSFGNTIGGITANITGTASTGVVNFTGIRYGVSGSANFLITNNTIGSSSVSNSINFASSTEPCVMGGVLNVTGGTGNVNITNNTIANLYNGSSATSSYLRGIYGQYSVNTITGNSIYNLSSAASPTGTTGTTAVVGIAVTGTVGDQNVSSNQIYSLSSTNTSAAVAVTGIYAKVSSSYTNTVSRNNIYGLTTDNTNTAAALIRGISFDGGAATCHNNIIRLGSGITANPTIVALDKTSSGTGNVGFYFNTVNITGSPSDATSTGNSYGFRKVDATTNDLFKNNIIINQRSNSGASVKHYAVSTANKSNLNSDYNLLLSNGTGGYIGVEAADYTAFTDWKTGTSLDAHSVSASVPFISTTDLHIDNTQSSCWNVKAKGTPISTISTDYDGDARATSGNQGVDLGADEFTAPSISGSGAIEDAGTTTFSSLGVNVASIAWHKGSEATLPTGVQVNYYPGTTPPGSATGAKTNCYWTVTPTGGTTGNTYDVTFYYDESFLNGIAEADLRLAKSDDGGNTYVAYTETGNGYLQSDLDVANNKITVHGISSFSQFTLSSVTDPLPIELSTFNAIVKGRDVQLDWETKTELNSSAFIVEKAKVEGSAAAEWKSIGSLAAAGNSNSPLKYSFSDKKLASGKFKYRLKMVDNDGSFRYSQEIDAEISQPTSYGLSQNYPNPFNPSTIIEYQIPVEGKVVLELYSITGQRVATLVNSVQSAGFYSLPVNAQNYGMASGIYIYRLTAAGAENTGRFTQIKKMILMK